MIVYKGLKMTSSMNVYWTEWNIQRSTEIDMLQREQPLFMAFYTLTEESRVFLSDLYLKADNVVEVEMD